MLFRSDIGRNLTREGGALVVVVEARPSGVVPIQAVALLAGKVWDRNIRVVVPYLNVPIPLVHGRVAQLSESEDCLIVVKQESLRHLELARIHGIFTRRETVGRGLEQLLPLLVAENDVAGNLVERHLDIIRPYVQVVVVFFCFNASDEFLTGLDRKSVV